MEWNFFHVVREIRFFVHQVWGDLKLEHEEILPRRARGEFWLLGRGVGAEETWKGPNPGPGDGQKGVALILLAISKGCQVRFWFPREPIRSIEPSSSSVWFSGTTCRLVTVSPTRFSIEFRLQNRAPRMRTLPRSLLAPCFGTSARHICRSDIAVLWRAHGERDFAAMCVDLNTSDSPRGCFCDSAESHFRIRRRISSPRGEESATIRNCSRTARGTNPPLESFEQRELCAAFSVSYRPQLLADCIWLLNPECRIYCLNLRTKGWENPGRKSCKSLLSALHELSTCLEYISWSSPTDIPSYIQAFSCMKFHRNW